MGAEAAHVGFDWENARDALDKVREEVAELEADLNERERAFEELGDLLFAVANVARKLELDPDAALQSATDKFERRFALILDAVAASGRQPTDLGLAELEALWQATKT